eukprot:g7747.t1
MRKSALGHLCIFVLLVELTARQLPECTSGNDVVDGIVAVDGGCHDGCNKLEQLCPGYECICFLKNNGQCFLNVKKIHLGVMEGCTIINSESHWAKVSQLFNNVPPVSGREMMEEETSTPSTQIEPAEVFEAETNKTITPFEPVLEETILRGPEVQPEVLNQTDVLEDPNTQLDLDTDDKTKDSTEISTSSTEYQQKRDEKDETKVLQQMFSLEDEFDAESIYSSYDIKETDIFYSDTTHANDYEELLVEEMMQPKKNTKNSEKTSFDSVKDTALDGADALEKFKQTI